MEWNYESKKSKKGIIVIVILAIIATIVGICSVCLFSETIYEPTEQSKVDVIGTKELKNAKYSNNATIEIDLTKDEGKKAVTVDIGSYYAADDLLKAHNNNYIHIAEIDKITNYKDGLINVYINAKKAGSTEIYIRKPGEHSTILATIKVIVTNVADTNPTSSSTTYHVNAIKGKAIRVQIKGTGLYPISGNTNIATAKWESNYVYITGINEGNTNIIIYNGIQQEIAKINVDVYSEEPETVPAPSVSPSSGNEINLKPGQTAEITLDWIDRFDNVYTDNTYVANFTCNKASDGYYKKLYITANGNVSSNTYCYVGLDNYGNPDYSGYNAKWKINVYPDVQVEHPTGTIKLQVGETKSFKLANATDYDCEIKSTNSLVPSNSDNSGDIVTVNNNDKQYLKITGKKAGTVNVVVKNFRNPLWNHPEELVYKIEVGETPKITYADKNKIQIAVGDTATRWFKPTGYASLDYHFSNSKTSSIATTKTLDMDEDGKIDNIQVVGKKVGKDYLTWEAKDSSGNNHGATVTWEVEVVPALKCTITPQTEVNLCYGVNYTNKSQVVYKIEFEDNVEGFTKSDITLTGGGTISSFNKMSDKIYIVTVTNPADAYYSQKISVASAVCYNKSNSNIKNKSGSCTVFVDRVKPAIKNVKASTSTSSTTGTMLVAKGSVINVTFEIDEEKTVASSLLDKNDVEFKTVKDGVNKKYSADTMVCSGKKYTAKWKVPDDVEEGSYIDFNVTGVSLIVDFAGNECDEYRSALDSGFRIIQVNSSVPEISKIQYFVYNNGQRDYGEDKVIHVSEGSQVKVRVQYNQYVVPSTVAFLISGNSRDYKVIDNYNKGMVHDYTFTVTSVLKPGEVTALIQGCQGTNGARCADSSFVEDSNGYKLICDNNGSAGETGDGPVKYKTFTYNQNPGKNVGNKYYAKKGDTIGTTIYFTDRFDDDNFTARLGNAVGTAVYQETSDSGRYDTFFTLGDEEEGPIKLTVDGFVQNVEKDWNGMSYVIDNTKPTIENFEVKGYQKDSIYIEFEEKDNMALPNEDLTADNITVKVGDTQYTNVIVKRISDEVEDAADEEEQEAQYDENAVNGEASAITTKKYEVIINGIQNAGDVSFTINSVKDMAGNEISYEQENLEFVNPENASFKKATCVVKRDGNALTGETKYIKNGDVIEFNIEFTGELLQTPTVNVSGAECDVVKDENNSLKYIATYTFDEEDEIPQGAIKFYLNDVISQNGLRLSDMRKTLDTYIYDSIAPEIKDVEISPALNDDSKITMKFRLYDENMDVNTAVKKSNIKVLAKGQEIDSSKYTLTLDDDLYTLVVDDVNYEEPYLIKIESTSENVIEDFSQNELTSYSTAANFADTTAPLMSVVRSVSVGEQTDEDITLMIIAEDKESGIKSITVNGKEQEVEADSAIYTVKENGEYEIVVTNNAGLTTSKTETIAEINRTEYRSQSGQVTDDGTGDNGDGSNGQGSEGAGTEAGTNTGNKESGTDAGRGTENGSTSGVDEKETEALQQKQAQALSKAIETIQKDIPFAGAWGPCVLVIVALGIAAAIFYKKYKEI